MDEKFEFDLYVDTIRKVAKWAEPDTRTTKEKQLHNKHNMQSFLQGKRGGKRGAY